ncbi:MAG: PAS domain S-box protein [Candidatus Edwardsbacteria bacterium]|nr:PAS domain S-box protein [Candidatus Edwardsbacteria bacterium]MBU1577122.1 PAS domain S-box protein [Candidatus Edwardsbacteria bacterium]MBU2463800.1 PAS domain S-box protein [Candidatus Edwardsbacteria bacterium]MBU2593782.1 PAS domain S-box protein [Candidatus Edwardsbacteria bacterium]
MKNIFKNALSRIKPAKIKKRVQYMDHKTTILIMRWLIVLLVILLAGFSEGGLNFGSKNYLLAIFFFVSNMILTFVPARLFEKQWLNYVIFLSDICFVSASVYFAEGINTDFYLIYFLSIFMSSVGQNVKSTIPVAFVASVFYGWLVYHNSGPEVFSTPSFWIRLPFFFLVALFSSYWASQAAVERKKKEEEERVNQRLKREIELATDEILKSNESLKYYKEYNDNIMASVNSGVIVVDVGGVVTTFNKGASDIFHIVSHAVIGKKLNEHPRFKPINDLLIRTMETGENVHRNEIGVTSFSDKEVAVGISTSLLHSQTARTNGAIAIFSDLTKTKSLEERVKHSEKLAVLGEMAAVMAHEIRNPLNSIAGFSQLLQSRVGEADKNRKYVDIIVHEAFRVDTLISDILDFAHQKKTIWSELRLDLLIDKVIDAKKARAAEKNIQLAKNIPASLSAIHGDAVRLERVILNLTNNAIEAINDGGRIEIAAIEKTGSEGQGVELTVSDNGCGIPPENLDSIFKPFFTTKQAGTGLGMAIIQKIIEEHQGHINVESEIGRGTKFTLFLPLNKQLDTAEATPK